MIKKSLLMLMLCSFPVFGVKYHQDSRGAEIHIPFRWIVTDSTARMALSVAAADTQKFCFQLADTTIWCLIDNSPKNWAWVSGKKVDSLVVKVLSGAKVIRDTTTFTGGAYFAGISRFAGTLYAPVVDIDSMIGDVKIGGNLTCRTVQLVPVVSNSSIIVTSKAYGTRNSDNRDWSFGKTADFNKWFVSSYSSASGYIEHFRVNNTGSFLAGACTTSTLNTGNGDNELHPMNQDVRTTASPTFAGITISGNSDWYKDTTFYDSLYDASTYVTNSTARIVKTGKIVTLYQPEMIGTLSGGNVLLKGIPTNLKPSGNTYSPCVVKVGVVSYPGVLSFSSGSFYLLYDNGTAYGNPAAGSDRGLHCCTITWVIN